MLGALGGAAIALIFAPGPGEETREQIKEKGIELKARAQEFGVDTNKLEELRDRGQELLEQQRVRFQEAVEEGKLAAERRKEELLVQFEASTKMPLESIDLGDIHTEIPPKS